MKYLLRQIIFITLSLLSASALAQISNPPTWNPPQPPIFIGSSGQVLAVQPSGALAFSNTSGGALATCSINAQTGTTYTLALTDANQCVTMNNAIANTVTIPANATVAFPVGTVVAIASLNFATTVSPAAGVTLANPPGSVTLQNLGQFFYIRKNGTNTWVWDSSPGPSLTSETIGGIIWQTASTAAPCNIYSQLHCANIGTGLGGGNVSIGAIQTSGTGTLMTMNSSGDINTDLITVSPSGLPLWKINLGTTTFQFGGFQWFSDGTETAHYYITDTEANCANYWGTQPWVVVGTLCEDIDTNGSPILIGTNVTLNFEITPNDVFCGIGGTTPVQWCHVHSAGTDAEITLGDSSISTSSINILSGSGSKPQANGVPILTGFTALSASIGGGALGAGACASTATTVTGATVGMVADATPNTYPGDSSFWKAYVSGANTVTVLICEAVAGTPTASTYNIRVIK